ncbi:hydantoinase/oxoprolinase family protein [Segnochrobactrum spirostomi]|uniref:hydantoinase/oxoprolinase family protein n=1 Tax=Segnochrobactrum spirostomi TaxID=2608987 RepID=UPI0028A845D7|nr:hydantoinase/oxoprolinase family protein [Segnochrobactrum spirostomi]
MNTGDAASLTPASASGVPHGWQGRTIVGLDVGGAHTKGALARDGRIEDVVQIATPLWQGLHHLDDALASVRQRFAATGSPAFAVTVTAELTDAFASRRDGISQLADRLAAALGPETIIYAGPKGFLPIADAADHVAAVASANWHATAALVGRTCPNALLVDIGSTTADLIPIVDARPAAQGYGDAERLASGELLYTGATRTFVMAIADRVPFAGRWQPLMNEYFASMADVRRITGELPEGVDQHATADGRGKSLAESRARLARMVGYDAADAREADWLRLAHYLGERQLGSLFDAASLVLSHGTVADDAPIVGAGIGDFLSRALAHRLGRRWISLAETIPVAPAAAPWAARAAPAVAVALLAGG